LVGEAFGCHTKPELAELFLDMELPVY
jgi:hypothetical protein